MNDKENIIQKFTTLTTLEQIACLIYLSKLKHHRKEPQR